jgi:hypothetical protein
MAKIIELTHPLQCRKCNGTVLPDQAICLPNEVWVLRYICLYCGCRWHAVKTGDHWVLVKPTRRMLVPIPPVAPVTGDKNDGIQLPPAIAA